MRTSSTPEIAFDNVQLEADFVQRATELRTMLNNQLLERDNEQLFDLTEQIRSMREHIAHRELAHNEKLNELHTNLQSNLNELSKLNIEIQAEFRRQHSKLRQELADKIDVNRQRAIALQKGELS